MIANKRIDACLRKKRIDELDVDRKRCVMFYCVLFVLIAASTAVAGETKSGAFPEKSVNKENEYVVSPRIILNNQFMRDLEEKRKSLPYCQDIVLAHYNDCCDDNKVNVFKVDRAYLENVPVWKVGHGKPPLDIETVLYKVMNAFSNTKKNKEYYLERFSLVSKKTSLGVVWYYSGGYIEKMSNKKSKAGSTSKQINLDGEKIIVLLDGTVVREETMSEEEYRSLSKDCQ